MTAPKPFRCTTCGDPIHADARGAAIYNDAGPIRPIHSGSCDTMPGGNGKSRIALVALRGSGLAGALVNWINSASPRTPRTIQDVTLIVTAISEAQN